MAHDGVEPEAADMDWPAPMPDRRAQALRDGAAAPARVIPLFIVPREYVAETKERQDLLVYDQDTGKRIVYVSPRGHHREIQEPSRPRASKDAICRQGGGSAGTDGDGVVAGGAGPAATPFRSRGT